MKVENPQKKKGKKKEQNLSSHDVTNGNLYLMGIYNRL